VVAPLIFVQLNELNFDVVRGYIERYGDLPNFTRLISEYRSFETYGEDQYEELEPWIQWVSAQTGRTFAEHGVFRLGDIVGQPEDLIQVFEVLEKRGLRVGAISPMNARNRLTNPAYFIPDPWTDTPSDDSTFSRRVTEMLNQTVNDNASSKISVKSKITLIEAILRTSGFKEMMYLAKMVLSSRGKPWIRALILDEVIHSIHCKLLMKKNPDVSFVFFNAGAHIQHHYFLNSKIFDGTCQNPAWYIDPESDPIHDMLIAYDRILGDYIDMEKSGARFMVATGLTQVPYDRAKYYYRLSDHAEFMKCAGLKFDRILPRMTRDFEAFFSSPQDLRHAAQKLASATMAKDGASVFGEIEERGDSLFVTLTYPKEILPADAIIIGNETVKNFGAMLAFVALKNGMHSSRGFAFLSPAFNGQVPLEAVHVGTLFDITLQHFAPATVN
jgi:hypothetical protein